MTDSTSIIFDQQYYIKNGISRDNPLTNLGAGDSSLYLDVLPPDLHDNSFNILDQEIIWNEMGQKGGMVPRLISIQGDKIDGLQPLYRHPADEHPILVDFSPLAKKSRDIISDLLKQEFNHALIQKYRCGKDHISEHADKTLDISRGSLIVNLSIGATRTFILRSKPDYESTEKTKNRVIQKIVLPSNSLFVLGWETNRLFTHSIKQDKRIASEKNPDELMFFEQRISLTFRKISTFLTSDGLIIGQGAKKEIIDSKMGLKDNEEENEFHEEGQNEETIELLKAFSVENRSAKFDWDFYYGKGFNTLNFKLINK